MLPDHAEAILTDGELVRRLGLGTRSPSRRPTTGSRPWCAPWRPGSAGERHAAEDVTQQVFQAVDLTGHFDAHKGQPARLARGARSSRSRLGPPGGRAVRRPFARCRRLGAERRGAGPDATVARRVAAADRPAPGAYREVVRMLYTRAPVRVIADRLGIPEDHARHGCAPRGNDWLPSSRRPVGRVRDDCRRQ